MKLLSQVAAALLLPATLLAGVVRPAPNFAWAGAPGANNLRAIKGQPVVLVVAPSPKSRAFKKQVKLLKEIYDQYASRGVVFAAAFTEADGQIQSDIPFVTAKNGAQTAADYGVTDSFALAVIGRDGNLDMLTSKISPASRVRDVIVNSYEIQASERVEGVKQN